MFDCGFNERENGCVSVVLYSIAEDPEGNAYVIEEGSGPIFTLKYDVSTGAPQEGCKELTSEELGIVDEDGLPIETVGLVSGQFCFTQTVSTTTTTGPIITTTTTTTASSSTTTIPSSCEVSVSPLAVTIQSGTTMQFNVQDLMWRRHLYLADST